MDREMMKKEIADQLNVFEGALPWMYLETPSLPDREDVPPWCLDYDYETEFPPLTLEEPFDLVQQ